jgi:hypothetical protein
VASCAITPPPCWASCTPRRWVSTPDYDSLTDDEKATLREVSLYRTAKAMEPKRAPIDVFLNNAPFASIPRNEDGALFIDTSPTPDRITVTFRRR